MVDLVGEAVPVTDASELLQSGASGIFIFVKLMEILSDDIVNNIFTSTYVANERSHDGLLCFSRVGLAEVERASHEKMGSVELNLFTEKKKKFVAAELLVLLVAITTTRKAASMMEEASLLEDAVSRLDDLFLLVIVFVFIVVCQFQRLLQVYLTWLESSNNSEARHFQESFTKRWGTLNSQKVVTSESYALLRGGDGLNLKVLEDFSANAAARLLNKKPVTWLLTVSNFPEVLDKVKRVADSLAPELKEAMLRRFCRCC